VWALVFQLNICFGGFSLKSSHHAFGVVGCGLPLQSTTLGHFIFNVAFFGIAILGNVSVANL
jgi:hypothetical protein